MAYMIFGGILAVLGVILWIIKGKKENKSAKLSMLETSRINDVLENYAELTASMGQGSFSYFAEVRGKAHADVPIESDFSKENVVYFSSEVVHEYEKLETQTDSKGKKEKRWVKHQDTVSENTRWADGFGVKDDTGFIAVNATKSTFHTEKLFSSFEKGEPSAQSGLNFNIKGFSFGVGGSANNGLKTIGYRYTETGIRLGTNLYVVGDANDREGRLQISKPKEKSDPFIVSVKSKDEMLGSLGSAAKGLTIGAIISWLGAAALIVVGIIKML